MSLHLCQKKPIFSNFWHCTIFSMFKANIHIPIFHKYTIMTYSSILYITVKTFLDLKEIRMPIFTQIQTLCTHVTHFIVQFDATMKNGEMRTVTLNYDKNIYSTSSRSTVSLTNIYIHLLNTLLMMNFNKHSRR
jgi:hypothetical protein